MYRLRQAARSVPPSKPTMARADTERCVLKSGQPYPANMMQNSNKLGKNGAKARYGKMAGHFAAIAFSLPRSHLASGASAVPNENLTLDRLADCKLGLSIAKEGPAKAPLSVNPGGN